MIKIVTELIVFLFEEASHNSRDGFRLILFPLLAPLNTEPLDARGAASSII